MRTELVRLLCPLFLLSLAFFAGAESALADEVVLRTGSVLRGTVVKENEDIVVLRTGGGVLKLGRALVKEIRRAGESAVETPTAGKAAELMHRIPNVRHDVPPAATGRLAIVATVGGGVAAWDPAEGVAVWRAEIGGAEAASLSATPEGVFVATRAGYVVRLDPRTGRVLWATSVDGPVQGPPLKLRRLVFAYGPSRGIYALDGASGKVRGVLALPWTLDTPLATDGIRLLAGAAENRLLVLKGDGTLLQAEVETASRWHGRALAMSIGKVLLGGAETLVAFSPASGTPGRPASVPGLEEHPLAADPARVYCEIGGVLSSVLLATGRVAWCADGLGRVTHLTAAGGSVFVTTSDGRIGEVSVTSGREVWTAELGACGTSAPLRFGDDVFIVTHSGEALIFRIKDSDASSEPDPAAPEAPRTVRSPDGYSIAIPAGWEISEQATRGAVSLGLQPVSSSPRFRREELSEVDLRRLVLRSHISITVKSVGDESDSDLGLQYLTEEQLRAQQGGYRVASPQIRKKKLGAREWTEVRVEETLPGVGGSSAFVKRAVVGRLDAKKAVWIEILTSKAYEATTTADFEKVAASFEGGTGEGVADTAAETAQKLFAAIEAGEPESVRVHLSTPLRRREMLSLPEPGRIRFRLVDLTGSPAGAFRRLRVRVQEGTRTRFAWLTMGEESGRWVVMDMRGLF